MTNANTKIYDGAVDRAAMIRLYEDRTTDKVNLIIDGHSIRVDKLIKKSQLKGGFPEFKKLLEEEIKATSKSATNVTSRSLLDLFRDQVGFTTGNIDRAVSDVWRVKQPPRSIAEDIVLKQPLYSNVTLSEGWKGIGKNERIRIEDIIRHGISLGQTEDQIAKTVFEKAYSITKNQAKGLTVTGITSVYAQADHQVYKANEKMLQGYQYIAVLDARTTPLCASRDGKIYPISDTAHLPPAHWYCYHPDTEVMTRKGFKKFKFVTTNDECLSLDPNTEDLSWQPVVRVFHKVVDEMVYIRNQSVRMGVSIDHPFIGQKRVDRGDYLPKEWVAKKYESILDIKNFGDFRLFASSKWQGMSIETMKLGAITVDIHTYLKFMAWFLSDGSTSEKYKGYIDTKITQYTHKELFLKDLSKLKPTVRKDGLGFTDQALGRYLRQFGKCNEKFIPNEIKELSSDLLEEFLEAYLLGDGCSVKQNDFDGYTSKEVRHFFSTSKKLADDLCELIIKAGWACGVTEVSPNSVIKYDNTLINGNYVVYKVYWARNKYRRFSEKDVTIEFEKTDVYDVELAEKHTLLTKFEGRIIWGSNCRSSTIPIVKKYDDLLNLEGITQIRKRNLQTLTPKEIAFYDGQSPLKESYNDWLMRQPKITQIKHLGDINKLNAFQSGQLTLDKFSTNGNTIGIKELRQLTDPGLGIPGDTRRFAAAKERLDTLKLGASRPDELIESIEMQKALKEYYLLQTKELDGTISLINYRGTLLGNKKNTKIRVLNSPPTEAHLKFNPITGTYNDSRMYQPNPDVLTNNLRLVTESDKLLQKDKDFITAFVNDLEDHMGVNERAVISDNLRITFSRFRDNKEPWQNFKAVLQGQTKFDVMNVSDYLETQLRKDANMLVKLKQANFIDPVLGPTQLQELHDGFIANIKAKNKWEDSVAPKIARELRGFLDLKLPLKLKVRLDDKDLETFYLKFANRLSLADSPDRDQLAVALGRDLYNMANYRGSRREWYDLGVKLLDDADDKGFYKLETFGVQKRRMKSRNGGKYFGPYYDTFSVNLRITDPRIQQYSKLNRKVDVGLRIGVTTEKNKLYIREGYKTYQIDDGVLGWYDTRIPITSTSSFKDFPVDIIDEDMSNALNWAADAQYKIDPEFHDFIKKLINFQDDKGKAQYYNDLNHYKEYLTERGDAYERLKAMEWLRRKDAAFSNHPFLDHRARIYERGFIGPQSGETLFIEALYSNVY